MSCRIPAVRFRSAVVAGLAALALLVPQRARALEKIVDGRFDYGLGNWPQILNGASLSWDGTLDASGSKLSGSYRVENQIPPAGNATYSIFVTRCFPASAGEAFFAGASMRFADDEPSTGRAKVLLKSYGSANCSGSVVAIAGSAEIEAGYGSQGRGVWTWLPVSKPGPALVVPVSGKSVELALFVVLTAGTGLTVNVDDVYLAPVGTPVCDGLPATIVGTANPDVIEGTAASDVIVGLGGADQIDGKGGNDRICGGPGNDTIHGGPGDDDVSGGGGADTLHGDDGDDLLIGGAGKDTLHGGNDDDVLKGGGGSDGCDGGPGADVAKTCESVTQVP